MKTPPPFPVIEGIRFAQIPFSDGHLASDDGRIWTCLNKNGRWKLSGVYSDKWKPLAGRRDKDGYRDVIICDGQGNRKYVRVSRLVLLAFIGDPPPGTQAAHENGDNHNDRLDNLAWKTPLENQADKRRHGTQPFGEKCAQAKLREYQVLEMRERHFVGGENFSVIARDYGVSQRAARLAIQGHTWSHL